MNDQNTPNNLNEEQQVYQNTNVGQNGNENIYATLVEKNTDYFLPAFAQIEQTGSKIKWNWCSFLFAFYWLLYRKMYIYALAFIGISVLVNFIPFVGAAGTIALMVCTGLFGTYIYKTDLDKRVAAINSLQEPQRSEKIRKSSGTNGLIVGIFLGITLLTLIAAFALAASFIALMPSLLS